MIMYKKTIVTFIILVLVILSPCAIMYIPSIGKKPISDDANFRCGNYYATGGSKVYWVPEIGECLFPVPNYQMVSENADSFEILIDEFDIARDSQYVFVKGVKYTVDDISTFSVGNIEEIGPGDIFHAYAKDSISVYYTVNDIVKLESAIVENWHYLGCGISYDGKHIYRFEKLIKSKSEIKGDECDLFNKDLVEILNQIPD